RFAPRIGWFACAARARGVICGALEGCLDEDPRVPGEGDPAPVRRGGPPRKVGYVRGRSGGRGARADDRQAGRGGEGADPRRRELYLGLTLDRAISRNVLMASSEGGVEIEEVAARHPEKILREAIDPVIGLSGYQARNLAFGLGLPAAAIGSFTKFATAMYRA